MIKKRLLTVKSVLILLLFLSPSFAFDHSELRNVLDANVDKNGFVNYYGIRIAKGGDIHEYISFLEIAKIKKYKPNEKLAFWVNAYNAHLIRLILARTDLKTLKDEKTLFKQRFRVANRKTSLSSIFNRVLRSDPEKGGPVEGVSLLKFDPRSHFLICKGSIGSPKLNVSPYKPTGIEAQLKDKSSRFVNDPANIRLEDGILHVSELFKWYESDFGGPEGVIDFITKHLDPKKRPDAKEISATLKSDYPHSVTFHFNWMVNDVKNKKK